MLASIHPLGERARGQRFFVTAAAYATGSVVGSAALGAILGGVGRVLFGADAFMVRALILGVAALLASVLDWSGTRVPSWRRQVNEDWLAQFRGWIYGLGFGLQLGVGVVTIVTTAAVYLTWVAALTTAAPIAGALVGASFGLARAIPLAASASLVSPAAIATRVRLLEAWDGKFRTVTVLSEAAAACVVMIAAVR